MAVVSALIFAAILLISYYYIKLFFQSCRLRRLSAKYGCAPPPTKHLHLPWGMERVIRLLRFRGDVLDDLVSAAYRRHGAWTHAVEAPLAAQPTLATADPENIKTVLATNFGDWGIGPRRANQFRPFLGLGVFTSDGEMWQDSRKLLRPVFERQQISDLSFTTRHVDRLLLCLGASNVSTDGWTDWVNAMPLIFRFTLDAASEFLFGESVESQRTTPIGHVDLLQQNGFESAFEVASMGIGLRMRLRALYWVFNTTRFRRACHLCKEYTNRFVDKALRLQDANNQTIVGSADKILERGIFLHQLAEFTQDRTMLRDQLMQLLFAGRDTTATLISFTFLCLARHPEAYEKLRAEVVERFGCEKNTENKEEISFENLKACKYLQYVLQETLRLYPPIPINTRQALRDTVLPRGGGPDGTQPIAVAKDTTITFSIYVMQRRQDLWGSDAAEWKPERWISLKSDWAYLPFNGGPRRCPGRRFFLFLTLLYTKRICAFRANYTLGEH
jgi:cytochrome P450